MRYTKNFPCFALSVSTTFFTLLPVTCIPGFQCLKFLLKFIQPSVLTVLHKTVLRFKVLSLSLFGSFE